MYRTHRIKYTLKIINLHHSSEMQDIMITIDEWISKDDYQNADEQINKLF